MTVCRSAKRLRNWHRKYANANVSLKEFARELVIDGADFEREFHVAGPVDAIAKRWLAGKAAR